jgi:predicted RNA-binding protein YlxR (DUF448 family)/ribosomal protein L30E
LSSRHAERHCIATGKALPATAMVRFVRSPMGDVVPDIAGDLPGRGVWITAEKALVDKAVKKHAFARGLKPENGAGLAVAEDLSGTVEHLLAKRCLDLLGLARRSGALVAGMEKVAASARAGKVSVLIAASDGAADGREKLKRLCPGIPVVELFSSGELGLALGRENVIHAALTSDGFAGRLMDEVRRLHGFRSLEGQLVDE